MKPRALILGPPERAAINTVVGYAQAHPINLHDIMGIMGGRCPPPGDDPQRVCVLPQGYRVAFTIEQHPGGWCRHISISVLGGEPKAAPNKIAVTAIMMLFGFENFQLATSPPQGVAGFFIEDLPDGSRAVNLIQKLEQ